MIKQHLQYPGGDCFTGVRQEEKFAMTDSNVEIDCHCEFSLLLFLCEAIFRRDGTLLSSSFSNIVIKKRAFRYKREGQVMTCPSLI